MKPPSFQTLQFIQYGVDASGDENSVRPRPKFAHESFTLILLFITMYVGYDKVILGKASAKFSTGFLVLK